MKRPDFLPGFYRVYASVLNGLVGQFHVNIKDGVETHNGHYIAGRALKLTIAALELVEGMKDDGGNTISGGNCKRCTCIKTTGDMLGREPTQPEGNGEE